MQATHAHPSPHIKNKNPHRLGLHLVDRPAKQPRRRPRPPKIALPDDAAVQAIAARRPEVSLWM